MEPGTRPRRVAGRALVGRDKLPSAGPAGSLEALRQGPKGAKWGRAAFALLKRVHSLHVFSIAGENLDRLSHQ
jgi:hypothetical protein